MKLKILIIISFLVFFLFGCEKEIELKNYSDPYLEAFWEKGIKSMVAFDPYDSISEDSSRLERMTFDRAGNIVHRMAFMTNDTMVYDRLHFITRQVQRLEAPTNFVITHYIDRDGNLIQIWNDLKHREWEYSDEDLLRAEKDTVKFEVNKQGRITKQHDSEKTILYYYADDKIIRKETYLKKDESELISVILFTYRDDRIEKIEYYRGKQLRKTHYFSENGLLDSTIHVFEGQSSVTKYRYEYFDKGK
ncbi:MAG TPA: hypothetical protein VGD65_25730 [Chryseosolibacter sp.]